MSVTAASLIVKMSADTKGAEQGISRVSKGISGFAKTAAAIGTGFLGAQVFSTMTRGFAGATAGALDFGAQMANVNSIAQLSDAQFAKLNDQVLALTSDPRIAQGPATLAAGLYDVYSSGFQGADGLKVLQQSALAATAGVTDTATAARVITANLNAFGLSADDAQRVSDVLFQTVNDGVITFEQLANNMGNVIPIANSLGLSIEDVGAAYAQMTLKGVPASQAETQIAALMRSALNPTEDLTAAVQAHGYATAAAAIESEGLAGFLDIVTEAAGGNQEEMFNLLGTQEAMNAATILGADGAKAYRKELDKMKGASKGAGATNKALTQQMKSASFQIAKAKQQLQTLATLGFGILAPVVGKAANALTRFISKGAIPFVNIIGKAAKGGFAFDKEVKKLPQPLQRTAHALGSIVEGLSDIIHGHRISSELTQIGHAFQAIAEEALRAGAEVVGWVLHVGVPTVTGWLADHAGDAWDAVKSLAGWTWDKVQDVGDWTLHVAIPSAITGLEGITKRIAVEIDSWLASHEIKLQAFGVNVDQIRPIVRAVALGKWQQALNSALTAEPVDIGPVLTNVSLGLPKVSGVTGANLGDFLGRAIFGDIKVNVPRWSLILSQIPTIVNPAVLPVAAGLAIQKKLGTIDALADWTIEFGIPSAIIFAANFEASFTNRVAQEIEKNIGTIADVSIPVSVVVDLTIDVVQHVKTGAEGIWDFLTGHITPLSIGGGPGGGGGTALPDISQSFNVTATLNKTQWDADYKAISDDVAAINGTMAEAAVQMNRTAWDNDYQYLFDRVNDINNTTAIAHADLDTLAFATAYDHINGPQGQLFELAHTTATATADLDIGPFTINYTNAFAAGNAWNNAVFTATLHLNTGPAIAAAYAAAQFIDSLLPHSPAKRGPLKRVPDFGYVGDAFLKSVNGLDRQMSGIGGRGSTSRAAIAGANRGGNTYVSIALKSEELKALIQKAETGHSFAHTFPRTLQLSGGA